MGRNKNEYHLELDIGDARILITMSGGFFDLRGKDAYKSSVHSHSSFEVHAVIEGEGVLETEHGSYTAEGGELLIVPPGTVHKGFAISDGIKTSFSFSIVKNAKRKGLVFSRFSSVLSKTEEVVKLSGGRKYTEYLEHIFYEYYSKNICSEERLSSFFGLLVTDLFYDLGAECEGGQDDGRYTESEDCNLIRSVMEEYVTVSFNKTPRLGELASAVHLGERQTARVFRQCFGESFGEYVMRARLDAAKYLLANTDKPLAAIALDTGYLSYNGFFKLFKKKTGISPEEYRRQNREENV
ncbi:MAG: helix-turn-helix transcriptional regulator [Clostridia bacterium]|nr:helix-turn-helix transcriptional regulator [Clostridia bacterium]